ncbi:MAG: hypothetical protein DMG16_08410 [Acidobacteria bacterium]|nr:MAG: hypothetical protein DMG16_08410 [Acidobacteriota bacterium]
MLHAILKLMVPALKQRLVLPVFMKANRNEDVLGGARADEARARIETLMTARCFIGDWVDL